MITKFILIFSCLLLTFQVFAQVIPLNPVKVSRDTEEKPQSKVWQYACSNWAILPNSTGTHLWRLDGTTWTNVMTISTRTSSKADCKVVGNVVHVLLYRRNSTSYLISLEYDFSAKNYKIWSKRPDATAMQLQGGNGTATIDVDAKGRMWLANTSSNNVLVRWSDSPYVNWSDPVKLATGVSADDICAIVALPGKMGVFWSNQNTRRFGFRTHINGADPTSWTQDEFPASQSALNVGTGMADDHMNFAVAEDGKLYCAVKTNYDTPGFPKLAMLIRHPDGKWDNLYGVSETGTRPIIVLSEELDKLKIIYPSIEGGGDILFQESAISNISFSEPRKLMNGKYNNPSSSKDKYGAELVVLFTNETHAAGVLIKSELKEDVCLQNMEDIFIAYPNPFVTQVTFYFTLIQGGEYNIAMYDAKGAFIAQIGHGVAQPGRSNVLTLEDKSLAHGLYVVRLQHSGGTKSLKLVREK